MNSLIKITIAILVCLTGSFVWTDNASGGKPTRVKVEAVTPDYALQGEERNVRIRGSGFGHGSTVRFLVSGTNDDSQVEITGVVLFDEVTGELVAPIQVIDTATVDLYDVEIQTSSGRRGKGTDLFRVELKAGGNVLPTYDVTFDGDLAGSYGDMWQSDSQQDSITYFASDPQGGIGYMDLSFFRDGAGGGPFDGTDGTNCFFELTPISAVQFFPDKNDDAVLKGSFIGYSRDSAITRTFMYHFTLTGTFTDPGNWLPQDPAVSATVTITDW